MRWKLLSAQKVHRFMSKNVKNAQLDGCGPRVVKAVPQIWRKPTENFNKERTK